jgi:hypothetical protein
MCLLLLTKVANNIGHHHVKVESRLFAKAHKGVAKDRLHATIVDAVIDVVALGVFIIGVLNWVAVGLFLAVSLSLFGWIRDKRFQKGWVVFEVFLSLTNYLCCCKIAILIKDGQFLCFF